MFPFAKVTKTPDSFSLSRECFADLVEDNPHSQGQGNREENKLHHIPAKIPFITISRKHQNNNATTTTFLHFFCDIHFWKEAL